MEQARLRLQSALKFTETLISAIPVPMFFKDRQGRYLGCNPAFCEFTGYTSEQLKGKTVLELWPGEFAEVYHRKDLELINRPERQVYEFQVLDKNKVPRPTLWAKNVFRDEHGQVAGIVGAFQDITERKQAEEALLKLNQDLDRRVKDRTTELEAKNKELARMNRLFVGRELRMVELKQRIRGLEDKAGQPAVDAAADEPRKD